MMKNRFIPIGLLLLLLSLFSTTNAQDAIRFYFGVDLSYVNEMEDCGAIYRENGELQDPFNLFADHGANLVRARLWHNPNWTEYSTLDDVKRTFTRAKSHGMNTLLDIHYSDNWADAGTQAIPEAWADLDDIKLVEAVYHYTTDVLNALAEENLVPALVQIGNETNSGILKRRNQQNWSRDAKIFNAGIQAVRDFAAATDTQPQILLHVAQPENTTWWFTQAEAAGITDFDVIGISYYPQWSSFSIADFGAQVSYLRERFGKQVMVLETAYPWTRDAVEESASNILNQGLRGYPFSPTGQLQFMTDLTQTLISNGALGIVYWEPAWVSTQCSTRWGQGSHWENATFFDFQNDNERLQGIDFLRDNYLHLASLADGKIEAAYGEPLVVDATNDVLNNINSLDMEALYQQADQSTVALALQIAGDVYDTEGHYLIYFDTSQDSLGADVDVGRRPITTADPYKPEFRLDISIQHEGTIARGSYTLNAWIDDEWKEITFTGGAAISTGASSVLEIIIPRTLLGDPQFVNIGVVSTSRGRVSSASDILGNAIVLSDASTPFILDVFSKVDFPD